MEKSTSVKMPQINLVRQKGAYVNTFLHWALTTGRLIIIITETVALSAFAMRFGLDARIVDLHDKIRQEQAIVDLLRHQEDTFRNLQDRLNNAQQADAASKKETTTFSALLSALPADIQVENFSFFPDHIRLQVDTNSTVTLGKLIQSLQSNAHVSGVTVETIDNKISEGLINATIVAKIK